MTDRYPSWGNDPAPIDPNAPIYLGSPGGISAYADQQTDAANTFLLQLGELVANLVPPVITPVFPDGPEAPAQITTELPEFQTVVWTAPNAPAAFTGDLDISDLIPASFTDTPPVLVFPTAPTFSELSPDAPPIDTSFEMPTLSVTLPAAPDLLSLSVVPFDGVTLPTFDAEAPEMTIVEPSIREYVPGASYTSALLTALQTSLQSRIEEGGTGLAPDVENAIWDRGREREARAAREALDKLDQMEALGFAFPPGVFVDARLRLITETDFAQRGHSREVMIKAAELELDNVKHALTTANALEGQLITYSNAVEQRLFDSCKYATEAGVAIYNAKVQGYVAMIEAFKALVQVYEAQIRGEIAKVEAYKAQIEAEQTKAQINQTLVESYKVQVDAAMSSIRIFEAEIEGIQAQTEIEKMKIMIYGEQVKAYGVKVNAYTAGVEGFRATIQAEGAKIDAYRSSVEAYSAQVGAQTKIIDARIAEFKGNLDANVSQWSAYESAWRGEAAHAQAISAFNTSLSDSFRAEVSAVTSFNETLTKQWQVALDQAQRTAEIGISAAKSNAELYVTTRSLALDAAKIGATVSSQLGAAALNAINWSSSMSTSIGQSISTSYNNSSSNSFSESTSHNYNYSASV